MDNRAKLAGICASILAAVLIAGHAAAPNAPSPQASPPYCGDQSAILDQQYFAEEEDEVRLNVGSYSRVSLFYDYFEGYWTIRAIPAQDPNQLCILDAGQGEPEDLLQSPVYREYFRPDLERAPPAKAEVSSAAAIAAQLGLFDTRDKAQAALGGSPGGATPRIEVVRLNGRTFYRATVTGFRDRAAAQAYCARVQGACVIR